METALGTIKLRFFEGVAPKAVENFKTHAKDGYYDGVIFHRVIKGFMIQGGDPQGTGYGGESIWGRPFVNEVSESARHFRGALCMANAGPDTNGSQFYIVQAGTEGLNDATLTRCEARSGMKMSDEVKAKYREVGGAPFLDGGYTVFGEVVEGMDVVDKITSSAVDGNDKPLDEVAIKSITLTEV